MDRELTQMQAENLDTYLFKSGDTMHDFMDKNPDSKVCEYKDKYWIEYCIYDDIFWIHTAFSKMSRKETKEIWDSIVKMAQYEGFKKIQFITERNTKAWEKLFKVKPVEWKMELDLTKE